MVYPVQVCSPFIVSQGHVSSPRTEADAVDLPEAESPRKVLVNTQGLQVENLDGGVLGNAGHDEHLAAGVEAKVSSVVRFRMAFSGLGKVMPRI